MQASKALGKTNVLSNFQGALSKPVTIFVELQGTQFYYHKSTQNPKHNHREHLAREARNQTGPDEKTAKWPTYSKNYIIFPTFCSVV